jgi:hypothetical protein
MINWGGFLLVGGRYNPGGDSWISTCDTNAPTARVNFTEIWTGSEMIVWGGQSSNAQLVNTGGRYSLHEPPPPGLILEAFGPVPTQAAALDSLLLIRDPFPVVNASALNQGADRNTRVTVFVSQLQFAPGQPPSAIIVHLVDGNNQNYDIPAEDVRLVGGFNQVSFRLPDKLAVGTCTLTVKANNKVSNPATIRIRL